MKHWRAGALLAGCGGFLVWAPRLAPPLPSRSWAAWWSWLQADPQRAIAMPAGFAAWLVVGWLFVVTLLSSVAGGGHAASRLAGYLAERMTPRAARGLLEALLGASLVLGPAAPALAGTPALSPVPAPVLAPPDLPPLLELDRADVSLPTPAPTPTPPSIPAPIPTHRVQLGDTLWALASSQLLAGSSGAEITRAWQEWYAQNRAEIGADPGLLQVGEILAVPRRTP